MTELEAIKILEVALYILEQNTLPKVFVKADKENCNNMLQLVSLMRRDVLNGEYDQEIENKWILFIRGADLSKWDLVLNTNSKVESYIMYLTQLIKEKNEIH